jgi:hypothetical protein
MPVIQRHINCCPFPESTGGASPETRVESIPRAPTGGHPFGGVASGRRKIRRRGCLASARNDMQPMQGRLAWLSLEIRRLQTCELSSKAECLFPCLARLRRERNGLFFRFHKPFPAGMPRSLAAWRGKARECSIPSLFAGVRRREWLVPRSPETTKVGNVAFPRSQEAFRRGTSRSLEIKRRSRRERGVPPSLPIGGGRECHVPLLRNDGEGGKASFPVLRRR